MANSGVTRAEENRRIRQEAVREKLANQGLIQHVTELARKIENSTDSLEVQKYRASADIQLKLINKYLPDLKSTEVEQTNLSDLATLLQQVAVLSRSRAEEKDITPLQGAVSSTTATKPLQ